MNILYKKIIGGIIALVIVIFLVNYFFPKAINLDPVIDKAGEVYHDAKQNLKEVIKDEDVDEVDTINPGDIPVIELQPASEQQTNQSIEETEPDNGSTEQSYSGIEPISFEVEEGTGSQYSEYQNIERRSTPAQTIEELNEQANHLWDSGIDLTCSHEENTACDPAYCCE